MLRNFSKGKIVMYGIFIVVFSIAIYILRNIIFVFLFSIINIVLFFFSNLVPKSDFLSDIATFEGILIGVTIPISLQVVSWTFDRYKDKEIAQFFIKETLYKIQFAMVGTKK